MIPAAAIVVICVLSFTLPDGHIKKINRSMTAAECQSLAPQVDAIAVLNDHPDWVFKAPWSCTAPKQVID